MLWCQSNIICLIYTLRVCWHHRHKFINFWIRIKWLFDQLITYFLKFIIKTFYILYTWIFYSAGVHNSSILYMHLNHLNSNTSIYIIKFCTQFAYRLNPKSNPNWPPHTCARLVVNLFVGKSIEINKLQIQFWNSQASYYTNKLK